MENTRDTTTWPVECEPELQSNSQPDSGETPDREWETHAYHLNSEASFLGKWMRLLLMRDCHRRMNPQITSETVRTDSFVKLLLATIGRALGSRATVYRDLAYAEEILVHLGADWVSTILGTPIANEDRLLRKIARLASVERARDVALIAVEGAGAKTASKLADRYLRDEEEASARARAVTPLQGSVLGTGGVDSVLFGDCLTRLKEIPNDCVQTCVTSPPFLGLRDYVTRTWFGGDDACEHDQKIVHAPHHRGQVAQSFGNGSSASGGNAITHSCSKCGAWLGQIGLEPTVTEYIEHLVEVFREVRRVLRDDGTCWIEIGDTYLEKRLQLVPQRLAVALADDGWIMRQEIVWSKPACLPEKVTDRPVRTHSTILMLSKSPSYFFDASAVTEPTSSLGPNTKRRRKPDLAEKRLTSVWTIANDRKNGSDHCATFPAELPRRCILASTRPGDSVLDPFAGSGTTLAVAKQYERRYLGIEINDGYRAGIERRLGVR